MEMTDYPGDLVDHYDEVTKRFTNGLDGTNSFGKMIGSLIDVHKRMAKVKGKVKLKTESNGGYGDVMGRFTKYSTSIEGIENEYISGMKVLKDDILAKDKELKKVLQEHNKAEKQVSKPYHAAIQKVIASQKKDKSDSQKWRDARKTLTATKEGGDPVKKVIDKQSKLETKIRKVSIKSRDNYEKSIEELGNRTDEYKEKTHEILSEIESVDIQFLERKKTNIIQLVELTQKYHQQAIEETQKLREDMEKIDCSQFLSQFIESIGKKYPEKEELRFEPDVEDKSLYKKEHPRKNDFKELIEKEPFSNSFLTVTVDFKDFFGEDNSEEVKKIPKEVSKFLEDCTHWHNQLDLRECRDFDEESIIKDRSVADGNWIHHAFPEKKEKKGYHCIHIDWKITTNEEGGVKGNSVYFEGKNQFESDWKGRFISKKTIFSDSLVRTNLTTGGVTQCSILICFGSDNVARVLEFGYDGQDGIIEIFLMDRWYIKNPVDQEYNIPGQNSFYL